MTAAETTSAPPARWLIGHLSDYQSLLVELDERPGLHPLIADPFSGTTEVLRTALTELSYASLYVDARPLVDELDLAMAIGDSAIRALQPAAEAWWTGIAPPGDLGGVRLRRKLSELSLDTQPIQLGEGPGSQTLEDALRLAVHLAGGPIAVAIDHIDDLLRHGRADRADPLATLRTARQRLPDLQLVLVGRPGGQLETALEDPGHPLFRAGQTQYLRRSYADRFVSDLAIGRPWLPDGASASTVQIAAELASGVPAYVWAIVDRVAAEPAPVQQVWNRYRDERSSQVTRHAETLGAIHPIALPVAASVATGLGAYALPLNDGRVRAALQSLQSAGAVWQPAPRSWGVADPLLASWLRENAPPWVRRRARAATRGPET